MTRSRHALVALALVAACSRVDGAPYQRASLGESSCAIDTDCGAGRYCSEGRVCAIDCVADKDCALLSPDPSAANDATCSTCGRCLPKGARDTLCLDPNAPRCVTSDDCSAQWSGYLCNGGVCALGCHDDSACASLGRGFTCKGSVCERSCIDDGDCAYHGFGFSCSLPPGIDAAENAVADAPVPGVCGAVSGGPFPVGRDNPGGDYEGTWGALLVISVQTTGIPIISQENTAALERLLVKITADGEGKLTFTEKWCAIEYRNFRDDDQPLKDLAPTLSPDRYAASLPMLQQRSAAPAPPLVAGSSFDTDRARDVRGARLPDPLTTPLPTYKDLRYAWDEDRDGHPGMTVTVTGIGNGDIYQSIRWSFLLHVGVVDRDHLAGLVDTDNEQTTLGASTPELVYDLTTVTHPVADRTYFRAQRLDDGASCDDAIAQANGWLAYAPHFDPSRRP